MRRLVLARAMALALFRDLGALAMCFVMPPVVFVIFALMFSQTGGADIQIGVAVVDLVDDDQSRGLIEGLEESTNTRLAVPVTDDPGIAEAAVRRGEADAGLIIRAADGFGPPRLTIILSPSREIAGLVLEGTLQERLMESAGDAAPVSPIERESIGPAMPIPVSIPYYAAGVALLFLLLSAMQGAVSLQEERETGLFDRLSGGPGGAAPAIEGKFLFLTVQGILQVGLIFLAAVFGFGLDISAVLLPWTVTTVLCAAAAAGLGLLFVTLCRTRRQALTLGNILVLVLSALGGSMVPRFLMPEEMQILGWVTPNTWGLEAYAALLWRGEGAAALVVPWCLLAIAALAGVIGARLVARRWA